MDELNKKTVELESELFALVNSITKLDNKYQKGTINDNFFKKALKNAMENLLKINFFLKENNINLSDLLKKMNFTEEYHEAIDIINHYASFNFSSEDFKNKKRTFLELPGITSEITSSFITLMDALNLEGFKGIDLIFKLFEELIRNLNEFPGLEDILMKAEKIHHFALKNSKYLNEDNALRERIGENLYQVFKEFQKKLNLKSNKKIN